MFGVAGDCVGGKLAAAAAVAAADQDCERTPLWPVLSNWEVEYSVPDLPARFAGKALVGFGFEKSSNAVLPMQLQD
jgi:hypothetical protein